MSHALLAELDQLQVRFDDDLKSVKTAPELEALRIKFLARKGEVTHYFKQLGTIEPSQRPQVGQRLNQLKQAIEAALEARKGSLASAQAADAPAVDLTLPGVERRLGTRHPLLQTVDDIKRIFISMGFTVGSGPEVETDFYHFEALNTPPDHPSRDLQDTFYLSDPSGSEGTIHLLRAHTSSVQIHTMERQAPPIRMIAPGRCYRRDTPDATHSPVFHQVEGLWVDEGVTMADLKGVLHTFAQLFFGEALQIRLRPSFFPFTEPSAELDVWFESKGRWLEVLGCGMVDPAVFDRLDIDSEKYTGFAFGMGVERLAMMKYGITDLRVFFENDVRFLRQFQ